MTLALEKLFVLIGGFGLGLLIFGATWRARNPSVLDSWNRRLYEQGPRNMRYGAILAVAGGVVLGVLQLAKLA
jgi:hypothetical protein